MLGAAVDLAQHPDQHGPQCPVLLAVEAYPPFPVTEASI
jgi:hypothetical protein